MKIIPMKTVSIVGAAVLFTLPAAPVYAQSQIVKVDGSSTVFPVTEAVAEDFQKAKKQQVKVTVGISGTGGGFKKFCRGETDISNASRPRWPTAPRRASNTSSCRWHSTR
jgi:phosphate transport system substrate-binding protein